MNHQLDPDDYPSEVIDRYQAARAAFIDGETEKAIQLATELAEEGYAFAQHVLGSVYVQSADVEHNPELARKWLTAAADNGFGASKWLILAFNQPDNLDEQLSGFINQEWQNVCSRLNEDDINEAQQQADAVLAGE